MLFRSLRLADSLVDGRQDLILAAVNEGIRKAQAMVSSEMAKLTGGLSIPGMM